MAKKMVTQDSPSYEEAIGELESIVKKLEQGGSALEEDLSQYARAVDLIKQCHTRLAQAERTVELLSGVDSEGQPLTEEFGLASDPDDLSDQSSKASLKTTGRGRREVSE